MVVSKRICYFVSCKYVGFFSAAAELAAGLNIDGHIDHIVYPVIRLFPSKFKKNLI